jgi:LacI family transcriptional regulator
MATLDEIAKAAGVSRMTVSNVLNGRNKETWSSTAERAERIREIARELNYRPNAAAKAVVTGRFGGIGLLLSREESSGTLFSATFRAVREALGERDLHLTVGDLPETQLTSEEFVPKILREWASDGLLINYIADIPPRMAQLIRQHHIPSVWMNARLPHDCVYPDDFGASRKATQHLIELGHGRIAYLHNAVSSHYSARDRHDGYVQAMEQARLKPQVIGYEDEVLLCDAQEFSRAWLSTAKRPTAAVAYEANYALPAYCAALQLGLQVPRDLSLLAFHERPLREYGLDISTMLIPGAEMGRVAVEMVLKKIADPQQELPPQSVPFHLEAGRTCGLAPTC